MACSICCPAAADTKAKLDRARATARGFSSKSVAPSAAPEIFADQAGNARLLVGDALDGGFVRGRHCRDLAHELVARCFNEGSSIVDRNHKRIRTTDDAILIINVEVLNIGRADIGPDADEGQA